MNIGLTGGIATGKSTVSRLLAERGAAIIDADVIAREIMEPGHPVLAAVSERFGPGVLHPDGTLNRKKLGEIVFSHPEERKALEALTHPAIRAEMKRRMEELEAADPHRLVVADIPLLYESGLDPLYDQIMVVYVPRRGTVNPVDVEGRVIEGGGRAADQRPDGYRNQEREGGYFD